MSDQSSSADATNSGPLFQNMDEQERVFAPQQVPGAIRDTDEVDVDGTVGGAIAGTDTSSNPDGEAVVGSEPGPSQTPVIPAQPSIVTSTMPIPPTAAPDLLTGREQQARDRASELDQEH